MIIEPLHPSVKFLSDSLLKKIVEESAQLLERFGVYVENKEVLQLFLDAEARVDSSAKRVFIPRKLVDEALASAPRTITMFDITGQQSFLVGGEVGGMRKLR